MLDDEDFSYADSENVILEQFRVGNIEELGLKDIPQTVSAVGALIMYLRQTQVNGLERITKIELYSEEQYVRLDYNTRRNLELTEPLNSKNKSACLFAVLNKTETSMGKRLLKSYIEKPLVNVAGIIKRQNGVTELYDNDDCTETCER